MRNNPQNTLQNNIMKAFQILDLKNFMGRLLAGDAFASFLLVEASVTTSCTFLIDGRVVKEFFTGDTNDADTMPSYEFSEWKDMQKLCFDLIKGKRTPVSFKFVLHLKPEPAADIIKEGDTAVSPSDVRAFVLTIKYENNLLSCVTGTSLYAFLPDKTPDLLWDSYISRFLEQLEVRYEAI